MLVHYAAGSLLSSGARLRAAATLVGHPPANCERRGDRRPRAQRLAAFRYDGWSQLSGRSRTGNRLALGFLLLWADLLRIRTVVGAGTHRLRRDLCNTDHRDCRARGLPTNPPM